MTTLDVLIIGAGPAGLGAAQMLAAAGARVVVAERQGDAGGVPRLCGHSPFGMREFRRILGGQSYAGRLIAAAEASGAEIKLQHSVTAVDADMTVHLATPSGEVILHPRQILLATGAREASRAERLLPGERPLGILTTGALQDLWFARRAPPFRQPLILGSELVTMSAILTCRLAGARPVAVVEPSASMITRAPFQWLPRALGIPVLTKTRIIDIVARQGRVAEVVLDGPSGQSRIACDGLLMTGDFRPEAGLARMIGVAIDAGTGGPQVDPAGRTSRTRIYAAGNLLRGIETAGWCWAEGRAVAAAMLQDRTVSVPRPVLEKLVIAGPGLRYVMPQRIASGQALDPLQVRLAHGLQGRLVVQDAQGRTLWSRKLTSGPERRIGIPLDKFPCDNINFPLTVLAEAT